MYVDYVTVDFVVPFTITLLFTLRWVDAPAFADTVHVADLPLRCGCYRLFPFAFP